MSVIKKVVIIIIVILLLFSFFFYRTRLYRIDWSREKDQGYELQKAIDIRTKNWV